MEEAFERSSSFIKHQNKAKLTAALDGSVRNRLSVGEYWKQALGHRSSDRIESYGGEASTTRR